MAGYTEIKNVLDPGTLTVYPFRESLGLFNNDHSGFLPISSPNCSLNNFSKMYNWLNYSPVWNSSVIFVFRIKFRVSILYEACPWSGPNIFPQQYLQFFLFPWTPYFSHSKLAAITMTPLFFSIFSLSLGYSSSFHISLPLLYIFLT